MSSSHMSSGVVSALPKSSRNHSSATGLSGSTIVDTAFPQRLLQDTDTLVLSPLAITPCHEGKFSAETSVRPALPASRSTRSSSYLARTGAATPTQSLRMFIPNMTVTYSPSRSSTSSTLTAEDKYTRKWVRPRSLRHTPRGPGGRSLREKGSLASWSENEMKIALDESQRLLLGVLLDPAYVLGLGPAVQRVREGYGRAHEDMV